MRAERRGEEGERGVPPLSGDPLTSQVMCPTASLRLLRLLPAVLGAAACGNAPDPDRPAGTLPPDTVVAEERILQRHERHVVFLTPGSDSTLTVHWAWETRLRPGAADREIRGTLARNGTWERFFATSWTGVAGRTPWRILPRRPVRLVMGSGESLERIIYVEGGRNLEVIVGPPLAEWTGPRGEAIRLHQGQVELSGGLLDGILLDMLRTAGEGAGSRDWALLTAGSGFHLFLEEEGGDPEGEAFRGWGRVDVRNLQWPEVTAVRTEVRSFEPARRDIPAAWRVVSGDGEFEGDIVTRAAHLEVLEGGEGPIYPVRTLFEVEGTFRVEGREVRVRGIWSHTRP